MNTRRGPPCNVPATVAVIGCGDDFTVYSPRNSIFPVLLHGSSELLIYYIWLSLIFWTCYACSMSVC